MHILGIRLRNNIDVIYWRSSAFILPRNVVNTKRLNLY